MQHWRTTENINMATQTGSTYICESTTDSDTILTVNPRFSTTASSIEVSSTDCDNDLQPQWQYRGLERQSYHFGLSLVVAIIWLHFCWVRHRQKCRICHWNFDTLCYSFRDFIISGFAAILLFPAVNRWCNHLPTLFRALHGRKP